MRSLNRTQNTRRNLIWGVASKAITVMGPFIVRAMLIRRLGAEYLGVSSLYTSILQVLSLAELGFSTAVVYGMYKPVSVGDIASVAAYLNYFKRVYHRVGMTILAFGLACVPFLERLVKGSAPSDVNLRLAFLIYLGNAVLSYFLFAYRQSVLTAYQRSDLVSKIGMVTNLILYTCQVAVLALMPNYYVYAIVLPISTVVGNLLIALVVKREMPEFSEHSLKDAKLGISERRAMHKQIFGLMVQRVCNVSRNSLDSIVISTFIGLTAVAAYGNYLTLLIGVHGVLTIASSSMTAAVGNSIVEEDKEKNFNDLRLFIFMYAMISTILSACLLTCYQSLIEIWVGKDLILPITVPILMVAYFYLLTMGDMRAVYADAAGIWWEQRWRAICESIANIILNILLVQSMGIIGIILATIISLLFFNFIYGSQLVFKHYFGTKYVKLYYFDHAKYLAVTILSCIVSYILTSRIPCENIYYLILRGFTTVVISVSLLYIVYRDYELFQQSKEFIDRLIRR